MLKVENVVKSFCLGEVEEKIINDVSFSIKDGEFVAIMGPSGAGKSTILHIISGLLKPDEGNVIVDEINLYALMNKKDKMCGLLSGGERQRVAIARAMCMNPQILFADEPTGNLDSRNHVNIMNLMKKINKERKTRIIMVTHNEDNFDYFSRIIAIRDGKIKNM